MMPSKRFYGHKNQTEIQARPCAHKNRQACEMQDTVKAVMFVPYTVASEIAKRMRYAEDKLLEMTGYKMKIVERAGLKL